MYKRQVLDEGDITNVAVRRDRQKEGIGAFLMQSLIRLDVYKRQDQDSGDQQTGIAADRISGAFCK